jgi:mono/diheme cytochrome c family protein
MALRFLFGLALGAGLALGVTAAAAQPAGDAEKGRVFASEACASCHRIEPGVRWPLGDAPTFQTIADTRGMTGTALTVWFQTSHPTMPNLILTAAEKADVIAYILSLRQRPQ